MSTEASGGPASTSVCSLPAVDGLTPAQRQRRWIDVLRRPAAAQATVAVVAVLAALWAASAFVVPVVMSVLLAVVLWPALRWTQRFLRVRALAALTVMVAATALTAALGTVVLSQLTEGMERVPNVLRYAARDVASLGSAGVGTWERTRSALEELDRSVARATGTHRGLDMGQTGKRSSIVNAFVEWMTEMAVLAGKLLAKGVLQAGVIALLTFFLLCTGDRLAHRLSVWCDGRPLARGRFSPLVCDTAREMRHFGAVTVIINATIAMAVAAGFAAFGVENPLLWGVVGGALHFVPYAGLAVLMALAAVEVYAAQASAFAALAAVAYVAVVGVFVGTAMATWLQGRASRVDNALMFGGTVFFSVLWGAWGLVLGPLLVVALHVVWRHAQIEPAPAPAPLPIVPPPMAPLDPMLSPDLGSPSTAPAAKLAP
ncbi:MAG: AI-2E family transporter [Rhizobacter sp.]